MKKSTLFETAKKSSVRPFWSYFLALHGQTYIELFVQPFTFLMFFDVFVKKRGPGHGNGDFWFSRKPSILSKNVALAMEILLLRFAKTQLTSCKDVCLDVCMYVWSSKLSPVPTAPPIRFEIYRSTKQKLLPWVHVYRIVIILDRVSQPLF